MEKCSKIALFRHKMSQKAPWAPLGPPRLKKIFFPSCQGGENPMLVKIIFELSPIGKKLV